MRQKTGPAAPFFVPKGQASKRDTTLQKAREAAFAQEVLGTPEGVKVFAEWSLAMKLFGRNRNRGAQEEG